MEHVLISHSFNQVHFIMNETKFQKIIATTNYWLDIGKSKYSSRLTTPIAHKGKLSLDRANRVSQELARTWIYLFVCHTLSRGTNSSLAAEFYRVVLFHCTTRRNLYYITEALGDVESYRETRVISR